MRIVNNLDWTAPLSAIDFLRDIGKYYRVGTMLKKDAVAARLESDAGISYTEFSYQILQGMDFLELYRQLRLRAADRGQRPVGQPHERHRPHPPRRGGERARDRHAAHHQLRRHEVRQERGQRDLARPAMCSAVRASTSSGSTPTTPTSWHGSRSSPSSREPSIDRLADAGGERAVPARGPAGARAEVTDLVHGVAATDAVIAASRGALRPGRPRVARRRHPRVGASPSCRTRRRRRDERSRRPSSTPGSPRVSSEARRAIGQGGVYLNNVKVDDEAATLEAGRPRGRHGAVLRRGKKTLAGIFVE